MVAVLDDVPRNIALTVIRRLDHAAEERETHLPAMSVSRQKQRDLRRQTRKDVRVMGQRDQRRARRDFGNRFFDELRTRPKIREANEP